MPILRGAGGQMLGLKKNENRLVDYDPEWQAAYEAERQRIATALGNTALAIEHIGSTSVPGLRAKPILDILVGVATLADWEKCHAPLVALGYDYAVNAGIPNHYIFGRGRDETERTHLVHIVEHASPTWDSEILFRDALRSDPELCRAYVEAKEAAIRAAPTVRSEYNAHKSAFVQEAKAKIIAEAHKAKDA